MSAPNPPAAPPGQAVPPGNGGTDPVIHPAATQPPTPPAAPAPAQNPAQPDYAALLAASTTETERVKGELAKAARERDETKTLLQKIAALFNPDTPPDPAKLTSDLSAKDAEIAQRDRALREKTIELAVFRHGGPNAASLLDSRRFMDAAFALDPTAADFATKLQELVRNSAPTAGTANGATPSTTPTNSGGADFTGGNSTGVTQLTEADLAGMSPTDIMKAKEQGRLNTLLGIKP